ADKGRIALFPIRIRGQCGGVKRGKPFSHEQQFFHMFPLTDTLGNRRSRSERRAGQGSCALRMPCCRRGSVAQGEGAFDATTMCLEAYGTTRCLTTQTADRQLCRGFDTGCCHAGLSDKVRDSLPFYRFRNNFVVAKKPLPLEPHINKGINDALHLLFNARCNDSCKQTP
ncbi:MAG: hypothetical protein H6Q45_491, partial [Deltaproteobacteria bacterium]|nr:hypothetical protein [Deltaproteobacteria bacterium]